LGHEDLQRGIRRRQHHRMDAWHNEGKVNLKGTKLLGSNEKVTLEAYLGNRRAHREWNWNVAMLKWNWNELWQGIKLMCFEDHS
jgi:hypothetical protein